ncbi:MAG: fdrA domain protein [Candidatus Eremiobacteraeota bacterium]|nr:fdrA domain protein [Candidatus Eremiobacteraeota bacterium]
MKKKNLLKKNLKVISLGLPVFYESLKSQGIEVIQVNWKPPARGEKKLLDMLRKLR